MMTVRTRFAPSPTGALHLGGARTALFSWLYAKKHQGEFLIRIEDTDQERSTPESLESIRNSLNWLHIESDKPYVYQSQRHALYQRAISQLLGCGKAYRCICSSQRLAQLREEQMLQKQKPRYDGCCRTLAIPQDCGAPYVVRFCNPTEGAVRFNDLVHGEIEVQNSELDDFILARSDGSATYNLTVVVDDADMHITQVIRGDDHINNTPRQINLFTALDLPLPQYAHIPLILGQDGRRLSKRQGACSVTHYKDQGILPEAMMNALTRLGWAKGDQEIISIPELIECFDLKDVNKSAATFDPAKLLWLNQHYMKTVDIKTLTDYLRPFMLGLGVEVAPPPQLEDVVMIQRSRAKTLQDMAVNSQLFYVPSVVYELPAVEKFLTSKSKPILSLIHDKLASLHDWNAEAIHQVLTTICEENEMKFGHIAQPIRVAVSGGTVSPPIDVTLCLLGREKSLHRIHTSIQMCTVA